MRCTRFRRMYLPCKPRVTSVQQPIDLLIARRKVHTGIVAIILSLILAAFSTLHNGLQRSRGSRSYVAADKSASEDGSSSAATTRAHHRNNSSIHDANNVTECDFTRGGSRTRKDSIRSVNPSTPSPSSVQSSRRSDSHAAQPTSTAPGRKRVVIVGAGPAGSALAALLAREAHLDITVIDKDTHHTFRAIEPLAHVGHRSYDLNTSGGVDYLHASSAWTVTRDVQLIHGTVTRVLPRAQQVMVRMAHVDGAEDSAQPRRNVPPPHGELHPCDGSTGEANTRGPPLPQWTRPVRDGGCSRWLRMLRGPHAWQSSARVYSNTTHDADDSAEDHGGGGQAREDETAKGGHDTAPHRQPRRQAGAECAGGVVPRCDAVHGDRAEQAVARVGGTMYASYPHKETNDSDGMITGSWPHTHAAMRRAGRPVDGCAMAERGMRVYDYDVLILACGASRSLGSLSNILAPAEVDRYRIALNPGTTRDALSHAYRGNILHIRVPSRLTAARVAAQRQARIAQNIPVRRIVVPFGDAAGGDAVVAGIADPLVLAGDRTRTSHSCPSNRTTHVEEDRKVGEGGGGGGYDMHDLKPPPSTWLPVNGAAIREGERGGSAGRIWVNACARVLLSRTSTGDNRATTTTVDGATRNGPASSAVGGGALWLDPLPCPMTPDGCSCLSCAPLYPTRPYEGAFVSTTNTIWKYLDYHKKLTLCRFYSVSAEAEPMCGVPDRVNNEIKALWLARQKRSRIHTGKDTRSHFLSHTCVVDIDPRASVVTLYNYRYHVDVVMPFRLMLLDLPLKAPDFVRASGLHRESNSHVWHDTHVPSGSRNVVAGSVGAHEHGGKDSSDEWFLSCRRCVDGHAATQANGRLVAATPPLPESVYEDELSFVDVDEHTLKHRRYDNIFALGDVAGLPTLKSYGAVFAQVPVVRHNVLQVLSQPPPRHGKQVGAAPDGREACAERGLARYDGYSSFHVIMTTWRAMWPEVRYNAAQRAGMDVSPVRVGDWAQRPQQNEPYEGDAHKLRSDQSFSAARAASNRLEGCNYHLWNNLHWRGVGGFVNALYYQTSLYEMMYFFLFMRGLWHPPSWFVLPAYSSTDGTPVQKSSFLTSWL